MRKKTSGIVVVSGLLPSPGRARFGTARQRVLGSFENDMFFVKIAKTIIFKNRTGIWTLGASGDASRRAKLWELSSGFWNVHFFGKSCEQWKLQESYSNLALGRLMDHVLAGQIMAGVFRNLKFAFFREMRQIVLPLAFRARKHSLLRTKTPLFESCEINEPKC